jgi:hypothetical protein
MLLRYGFHKRKRLLARLPLLAGERIHSRMTVRLIFEFAISISFPRA